MILIPPLFRFETIFGIQDRKVKGAVFIQSNYNSKKLYFVKSILIHLNFLNIIGCFTDEKEYPRGIHRIEELFDCYKDSILIKSDDVIQIE